MADTAKERIGQYAMSILDSVDNHEILVALGELTLAADRAARTLEAHGHTPTQAAVLVTGLCLRSWRMETRDDG